MKLLAIIPARRGSKGVPRKNVAILAGQPLVMYTVFPAVQAMAEGLITNVIVTTDDDELVEVVRQQFPDLQILARSSHLATDTAKTIDVVLNVLEEELKSGHRYDAVVLLQPTSPLRQLADIEESVRIFQRRRGTSLISVYCEETFTPGILYTKADDRAIPLAGDHSYGKRRQDENSLLVRNGALYITATDYLFREKKFINDEPLYYEMPKSRSVNIDRPGDLERASKLIASDGSGDGSNRDCVVR